MSSIAFSKAASTLWQRFSPWQKRLAVLACFFFGFLFVHTMVIHPLRQTIRQLHREVKQTEQVLVSAVSASRSTATVAKAFAAYAPYVKSAGSPENALGTVLSEVETSVRESGMVLLNLKPTGSREKADDAVSITVDGEATPEQLVRLLDHLYHSPLVLKVSELTVRVSESKTLRASLIISKLLIQ